MNKTQIRKDRQAKYGDPGINMRAFTKCIQAMVEQATQTKLEKDLPDDFGPMVMVACKLLRQCHKHDEDNYLDAANYMDFGRELNE